MEIIIKTILATVTVTTLLLGTVYWWYYRKSQKQVSKSTALAKAEQESKESLRKVKVEAEAKEILSDFSKLFDSIQTGADITSLPIAYTLGAYFQDQGHQWEPEPNERFFYRHYPNYQLLVNTFKERVIDNMDAAAEAILYTSAPYAHLDMSLAFNDNPDKYDYALTFGHGDGFTVLHVARPKPYGCDMLSLFLVSGKLAYVSFAYWKPMEQIDPKGITGYLGAHLGGDAIHVITDGDDFKLVQKEDGTFHIVFNNRLFSILSKKPGMFTGIGTFEGVFEGHIETAMSYLALEDVHAEYPTVVAFNTLPIAGGIVVNLTLSCAGTTVQSTYRLTEEPTDEELVYSKAVEAYVRSHLKTSAKAVH